MNERKLLLSYHRASKEDIAIALESSQVGDPGGNFWKPPQVFPVVLPLYLLCEGLDGKIWSADGGGRWWSMSNRQKHPWAIIFKKCINTSACVLLVVGVSQPSRLIDWLFHFPLNCGLWSAGVSSFLLPGFQWARKKSKAGEGPRPGESSDTHTARTPRPALYVVSVCIHSACLGWWNWCLPLIFARQVSCRSAAADTARVPRDWPRAWC